MVSFIPHEGINATLIHGEKGNIRLIRLDDGTAVKPEKDVYTTRVLGQVDETQDVENPVYADAYLVVDRGELCAALTRDWARTGAPDPKDILIEALTKIKVITEELV